MSGASGRLIAGRYAVLDELARGGMGRVLVARDRVLGRRVALKTMLGRGDGAARLRFLEEAQITGQLAHPNILPVHAIGIEEDGELHLVMKLVQGRDLKRLIRDLDDPDDGGVTAREYPLERLLRLFLKIADAVAFAHDRGVLHRDLKPANVMIGERDEVLVMDWGLARPIGDPSSAIGGAVTSAARGSLSGEPRDATGDGLTVDGAVVGTPEYMPPEQLDGASDLDGRADVYSLGAVLFEIVAHEPPYSGGLIKVAAAMERGPAPPPSERAEGRWVPPALESIIARAIAHRREDRYPDAASLGADVAALLDHRPVSAHVEGRGEALRRIARAHRARLVSVAVAGVAAVVLAVAARVAVAWAEAEARAEEAVAELDAERLERARMAIEPIDRLAYAAELAAEARRGADAFERRSRVESAERLAGAREPLVADLERFAAEVEALAREHGPTLHALRAEGHPVTASADPFAAVAAELATARARVDHALAVTLVTRDPAAALDRIDELARASDGPILRARALARSGRRVEAIAVLERRRELTMRTAASDAEASALAAVLNRRPIGEQLALLDAAVAERPWSSWLRGARAEARARRGDFDGARAEYAASIRIRADDPEVLLSRFERMTSSRAVGLMIEGQLDVIVAAGGDRGRLRALWRAYGLRTGNEHQSLDRLTEYLDARTRGKKDRIDEREADRIAAFGATIAGDGVETELRARRLLESDPNDVEALGFLALALVDQARIGEALEVSVRGLEIDPDDGRLLLARGEASRRRGQLAEAAPFLEAAARRSLDPEPWERLARCLAEMSDPDAWERGVEAARRALALDPYDRWSFVREAHPVSRDPALHRTLCRLRRRQGRLAEAALHAWRAMHCASLLASNALRPSLEDGLVAAEIHEELGLLDEAAALYGHVADLDPRLRGEVVSRLARLEKRRRR